MAARVMAGGPVTQAIRRKLEEALKPTVLKVHNASASHAGHAGNPGGEPDAETHFNVEVVSAEFAGKPMVKRHRLVYAALGEEFRAGLHALSLTTRTPEEASKLQA